MSYEAETAVLGSMILDPAVAGHIAAQVSATDFADPQLRALFGVVATMTSERLVIDPVTLRDRAAADGKLAAIGGAETLLRVMQETPSAANGEHYARIVREAAMRRRLADLALTINRDAADEESRPEAVAERAVESLRAIATAGTSPAPRVSIMAALDEAMRQIENPDAVGRIATGIAEFDSQFLGLPPVGMTLVGARPGVGKTAFAAQVAYHAAAGSGLRVRFYSLERTREDMALVVLCQRSGVPISRLAPRVIRSEDESERLAAAMVEVDAVASRFVLCDDARASPLTIRSELARIPEAERPQVVVVDYLGLLDGSSVAGRNVPREQVVSYLSRELKLISMEFRLCMIACAQLNRDQVRRDPTSFPRVSDLRDSGAQEQDADMVLLLHRPAATCMDPSEQSAFGNVAHVIVGKDRRGRMGSAEVMWDGAAQTFRAAADKWGF